MNRYNLDGDLFTNIEISNEIKNELLENCKMGKRTGDFRFKHAGALTALIATLIIGGTGFGVKACYESVRQRMESMPQEERTEISQDIENDHGLTIDDAWSRSLTNAESLRLAELERKYYNENLFPEQKVGRVDTLNEWDHTTLCYVEEDHLLHLPDAEMTDDQLLMFIDYSAKKDYVIEQEAEAYFEEEGLNEEKTPYVDVDSASEQDIIDIGYGYLKTFLGGDLSDEFRPRVEAFKPSDTDPTLGTEHDTYTIYWEQGNATPNSMDYVVVLKMDDLKFMAVAVRGREHWATLGSYTDEAALEKAATDRTKVLEQLDNMYGYAGEPDAERMEVYHEYDEYGDARQIRYVFTYGDEIVDVTWDIADEALAGVEVYGSDMDYSN